MHIEYGFGEVKVDGVSYVLAPTLINISKIGTPKEIVDSFKVLAGFEHAPVQAFITACQVLNACGLPDPITGGAEYSHRQKRMCISPGRLPVEDVLTLAWHCLRHGVCGESDSEESGEAITEFDAHKFIMMGKEFLGLTLEEANKLTMTQFVKLIEAKPNPEKDAQAQKDKESADAQDWYFAKMEQLNKAEADGV